MYELERFLANIAVFQIVMDILDICIGSMLVFGALKWRKGLITYTAIGWGLFLGLVIGFIIGESSDSVEFVIIGAVLGLIIFPILTYTVAGVNRFVVGYIVILKLTFMLTTWMFKRGDIELGIMFIIPIIIGVIAGIIFMAWTQMSVLPFVLACTFLGASNIAPTISKYINQFIFGITGDYSSLIDPIDLFFALFKIELTDGWTLVIVILLMAVGIPVQINSVKSQGFSLDTPVITYETERKEDHGKIKRV